MTDGRPDRAEYRKAFSAMVSSARSYLARCLIVLVLLVVVVEDRLTVLRWEEADIQEGIRDINRALSAAKGAAGQRRESLLRAYRSLNACITPPTAARGQSRARVSLPSELDLTFVETLPATPGELENSEQALIEETARGLRSHARVLASRRRHACWTGQVVGPKDASNQMEIVAKHLRDYARDYRTQTRTWNERNQEKRAKEAKLEQLTTKSTSVPTPFGGFDVIPWLALIGLVFGTFSSYVGIHLWIRRIRMLARRFVDAFGVTESITLDGPAPLWLCTADPSLDVCLGWGLARRRAMLAALFHLAWLTMLAVLAWETQSWDAINRVLFLPPLALAVAVYATVPIGIVLSLLLLVPKQGAPPVVANVGRRWLLRYGLPATLAIAAGVVALRTFRPLTTSGVAPRTPRPRRGLTGQHVREFLDEFVANPNTLTLHHERERGGRLKQAVAATTISAHELGKYYVHKGSRVLMTLALSRLEHVPTSNTADAQSPLQMMATAVRADPAALDLFDRFVSVCGMRKEYAAVESLIAALDPAGDPRSPWALRWAAAGRRHARAVRRRRIRAAQRRRARARAKPTGITR